MDNIKSFFKRKFMQQDEVTSVVMIGTSEKFSPLIDGFDLMFFVISEKRKPVNYISHYSQDGWCIQERWIHMEGLMSWILNGENRGIVQWLLSGELIVDKKRYLESVRKDLLHSPLEMRQKKLFIEFSLFLRRYLQGKDYIQKGHVLDAYNNVLEALQHWGRICIVESGQQPEVMVWRQLKEINLGVYKLYEELTLSLESLEERVELVLLACEFSVMSKMEDCCAILFQVLQSREQPWTANELKYHPDLIDLHVELAIMLKELCERGLIRIVMYPVVEDVHAGQGQGVDVTHAGNGMKNDVVQEDNKVQGDVVHIEMIQSDEVSQVAQMDDGTLYEVGYTL